MTHWPNHCVILPNVESSVAASKIIRGWGLSKSRYAHQCPGPIRRNVHHDSHIILNQPMVDPYTRCEET